MQRRTVVFLWLTIVTGLVSAQDAAPAVTPIPATLGQEAPFPYRWKFPAPSPEELASRRAALAAAVGNGVAITVSAPPPELSSGSRYKPDHDSWYFTGVDSDPCVWVMTAKDGKIDSEKLFLPTFNKSYELWNGRRWCAGPESAAATGIPESKIVALSGGNFGGANSMKPVEDHLRALMTSNPAVWYLEGAEGRAEGGGLSIDTPDRGGMVKKFLRSIAPEKTKIRGLGGLSGKLRSVKSPYEIELIRRAAWITGEGFHDAMRHARPGMWEFEFQGFMERAFTSRGATGVPYYPIAASGPNACILHYTDSRRQMQDGDVVLCDIAAEYGYYAADITRSFPVNGKFTPRQKQVYEAVLAGQEAAAAALKPGASLMSLDAACRDAMIAAGLKSAELHPHGLGHHVGLDVHDPGAMVFTPGMVITIEPGAYIRKESLGIRIEDLYLVTETGAECLSKMIPKTVAEIEALVGSAWRK